MIPWLDEQQDFPEIESALEEPNGLLAAGGDLSPSRIINAYKNGIFPWFSDEDPILWWSPAPRCIVLPNELHISRSMRKFIKGTTLKITTNHAFEQVMHHCSAREEGSWINLEMIDAYCQLHRQLLRPLQR